MIRSFLNILLLLFPILSLGQSGDDGNKLYEHQLDEKKWQDIRDGIRYEGHEKGPGRQWTYESDKEYNDAKKKYGNGDGDGSGNGGGGGNGTGGSGSGASKPPRTTSPRAQPPSINPPSVGGLGAIGYILLGVFIVALAVLIFYMFLNAPKDGKSVGAPIEFDEVDPTEIPMSELQRLLQEALSRGDYRGAIRIYFIFIIRDLAQKKWIRWEKEKTNFHYLREMSGKPEFEDFNRSVSYFEIIWYGKREIDASKFEEIKPNFTRFLDKLGVK